MEENSLEHVSSHFKFGKNWSSYSQLVSEQRIKQAEKSLIKLLGEDGIRGKTFLDVGCGSGIFSLAAARLGAKKVVSIDIDEECVKTTRKIMDKHNHQKNHEIYLLSVFDLPNKISQLGKFDVVYSWGVLHHTGNMRKAISDIKTALKDESSVLIIAVYARTFGCRVWVRLKKFYAHTNTLMQKLIRIFYTLTLSVILTISGLLKGSNIFKYLQSYQSKRGMSFMHDIHDWLGGYPYESISDSDFEAITKMQGLEIRQKFLISKYKLGILGSGCNEYVLALKL